MYMRACKCTRTHVYTQICSHTHTCIHVHPMHACTKHACICTNIHMHMLANIYNALSTQLYTYLYLYAYMYMCKQKCSHSTCTRTYIGNFLKYMHWNVYALTPTHMLTQPCIHVHTCTLKYMRVHVCVHMLTHTQIHMYSNKSMPVPVCGSRTLCAHILILARAHT